MIVCDCISPDPAKPDTMDVVKRNIQNSANLILLCMNAIHLKEENAHIKDKWFNLIKEVDPELSRTILVFTNVDNLPNNYNYNAIKGFLKEKIDVFGLQLGAVCVKANSSYSTINPALNHIERDYFNNHKVFQFLPNEYFTTDALAEKINKYITETYDFKKIIIEMNQKLKDRIAKNEKELQKFGSEYIDLSSQSKDLYMQSLINLFCKTVDKAFSGKAEIEADNLVNNDLKKLYVEFLDNFCKNQPSKNCKQAEIITIIQRSEGALVSGFPTGEVIYNLLDDEVESLRQEIKAYLDNVYLVVNNLIKDLVSRVFGRFPKAYQQIEELILGFLEQEFKKTKELIMNVAESNFNYLYIDEKSRSYQELLKMTLLKQNHPTQPQLGASGSSGALGQNQNRPMGAQGAQHPGTPNAAQGMQPQMMPQFKSEKDLSLFKSAKNKDEYYKSLSEYVKSLLDYVYYQILRSLREYVPKISKHFYIKSLKTNMLFYLLQYMSKNPEFVQNLEEDKDAAEKRKYYFESTNKLKNIAKEISYDTGLQKIIKGDNMKSIDNILQGQLKTSNSSENIQHENKPENKTTSSTNLFGNKNIQNNPKLTTPQPAERQAQTIKADAGKSNNFFNFFGGKKENPPAAATQPQQNTQPQHQPQPQPQTQQQNTIAQRANMFQPKNQPQQPQPQMKAQPQGNPQQNNQMNINLGYDPNTNSITKVGVQGEVDYQTAKKIYDQNKQYLPSGQQVWNGTKAAFKFGANAASQINEANNQNAGAQKKSADPLSSLFGSKKK